jgi:hypothetical protein
MNPSGLPSGTSVNFGKNLSLRQSLWKELYIYNLSVSKKHKHKPLHKLHSVSYKKL